MRQQTNREIKGIFVAVCVLFAAFLLIPMIFITGKSFIGNGGWTFEYYRSVFGGREFAEIFVRSVGIAMVSALVTTILAFILAYSIHFTNIHPILKKGIYGLAVMPMLLPTITYGFAIIYSWKTGTYHKTSWKTVVRYIWHDRTHDRVCFVHAADLVLAHQQHNGIYR